MKRILDDELCPHDEVVVCGEEHSFSFGNVPQDLGHGFYMFWEVQDAGYTPYAHISFRMVRDV